MGDKIQRQTQKIFAGKGGEESLAVFGTFKANNPIYTDNIESLQSEAYEEGWESAIIFGEAPFLEEMNGVQYGFSKQLAYLLQTGAPEWDAGTEYFANTSWCQVNGVFYQSLTDNNIGNNPVTDTTNWKAWKFIDIATDAEAASGVLETVAINPKQLQADVSKLQSQIDAITASSDVTDVVGTYAELQSYNTSGLYDKSIIKVLSDETQGGATTYYRWIISGGSGSWQLIGQEGPYYTKTQSDNTFAKNTTIGNLNDLETIDKSNLVAAINEAATKGGGSGSGSGLPLGAVFPAIFPIDESEGLFRYLNGSIMAINANTQAFVDKLKAAAQLYPSIVCSEDEWQTIATMSAVGQCGKFVVDEASNTVRLPKIVMPVQGLTDLSKLGELVEAGLPNVTGTFLLKADGQNVTSNNGPFYYTSNTSGGWTNEKENCYNIHMDLGRANPIYGNSDTVQQEQIQYPYYIVVATGATTEVDIKNEIELNNPFSLFDYEYAEFEKYNVSWAKGESVLTKAVYPSAYSALLIELNPSIAVGELAEGYLKRGLPVKNSTDIDITDYNFVVNTENETFRLPLKTNIETSDAGLYLYFYVGETVQNANLIDVGRVQEQLATKVNAEQATTVSMPSQKYIDLAKGADYTVYTAPADGYFQAETVGGNSNNYCGLWYVQRYNGQTGGGISNPIDPNTTVLMVTHSNANVGNNTVFLPVKKGRDVAIRYQGTLQILRFIYAEGAI